MEFTKLEYIPILIDIIGLFIMQTLELRIIYFFSSSFIFGCFCFCFCFILLGPVLLTFLVLCDVFLFVFLCCVSCTQCCLYHQIVHSGFAPLFFSVVCLVPNVACITGLSILGLPLCFSLLCVLYPMLPVSPDCPFWVFPFSFL